jgi:hypothetical protein
MTLHYMFTRDHHFSLSWTTWIQYTSFHFSSIKIHCTIVFPSVPRSSKWSLSYRFPQWKQLRIFLSLVYHMPHQAYPPWLVTITLCGKQYKSHSSLLHHFLWPTFTFSLFSPGVFFSTLFWNILRPGTLLNVADQVPHLYETAWSEFCIF